MFTRDSRSRSADRRHPLWSGQLYVNLRGFDRAARRWNPPGAAGFLEALGVAAERIPADMAAQSGLYRSLRACQMVRQSRS
jgi:hypothetical protein